MSSVSTVGQLSFCRSLFLGDFLSEILFPHPYFLENEEAHQTSVLAMLDENILKLQQRIDSAKMDKEARLPDGMIALLSQMGFMGLCIPEQYGGLGLNVTSYMKVIDKLSRLDGAITVTIVGHQSIGFKAISLFGTAAQKEKYYPKLASGELIASFALTEPGAGSDVASIRTKAVLSADGSHYILNGEKIWITNAGYANFLTVFAKTDCLNVKTKKIEEKITAFIVELPAEGVKIGPAEDKMGLRASWTGSIYFENVKVPIENVIGEVGRGFKIALEVLNSGRLGVASASVSVIKHALDLARAHAVQRKQFGKSLNEFALIQEKIAQMTVNAFVGESMVFAISSMMDEKKYDSSIEAAIAKIWASEKLWTSVVDAQQVFGGMGYMKECPIERYVRDVRSNMVFEGTNEVLRLFVALTGLQESSRQLTDVLSAIRAPLRKIGIIREFAVKQVELGLQSKLGMSVQKMSWDIDPRLKNELGIFKDLLAEFALNNTKLIAKHKRKISERQLDLKRIADIVSELFAMACVLSRIDTEMKARPAEKFESECEIARSFFFRSARQIAQEIRAFDFNDDAQCFKLGVEKENSYFLTK